MENINSKDSKVVKMAKIQKLQIEQKAIFSVLTECTNISETLMSGLVIAFEKISNSIEELNNEINA